MKAAKQTKRPGAPAAPLASSSARPAESNVFQRLLPEVVFFVVFFICLWKGVEVDLIYHGAGLVKDFPSFYWGWEFARDFQTHPGGFVEYTSALLAQTLYYSWLGALVLTGQAVLIHAGLAHFLSRLNLKGCLWIGFFPALLLLGMYSKYRHYSVPVTSFAFGVLSVQIWSNFAQAKAAWRLPAAFLLLAFLYAAVPMGLLVFIPLAILFAARQKTTDWKLLLCFGLGGLIPWLEGRALFGFAPGEAYAALLPFRWDPILWKATGAWMVIGLYGLPLLVCVVGLLARLVSTQNAAEGEPFRSLESSSQPIATRQVPAKWWLIPDWKWRTALLTVIPLGIVWLTLHPAVKAFLKVDYLAWEGRWAEVLQLAARVPMSPFVACAAAQADYHTGLLTSRLPALTSPADLLLSNDKSLSNWKKCDLYFDLGYVNMALHYLTESVEFYGERPVLLQRLALINLALGNVNTAKVYLGTLARAPFHAGWARGYLERLSSDPTLAGDAEVSRLRRLMVRTDSVVALSPEDELLMLLGANRQNRMAFEYLMTYYLLSKNLPDFVKNLPRLKDFPDLKLGPAWEEAILLAAGLSRQAIDVPDRSVGEDARQRVAGLTKRVQQYGKNMEQARTELAPEYGHTYTYYWFFSH
jgi:hypothetical protein